MQSLTDICTLSLNICFHDETIKLKKKKAIYIKDGESDKAVYTTKTELLSFLRFLDTNSTIQKFLNYDTSFRLADKYLIAMVFIYFKRAKLSPEDYTYLNFFAGLCLAHSMEEDIELSSEIYPWALGNELKNELPRLLELKTLLWMAMDYRAAVSHHCCKQLISISAKHPVWQRERSPFFLNRSLSIEADNHFHYLVSSKDKTVECRRKKLFFMESQELMKN